MKEIIKKYAFIAKDLIDKGVGIRDIALILKEEYDASRIQVYYSLFACKIEEKEIDRIVCDTNLWPYERDVTNEFYETLYYSDSFSLE